MESTISVVMPVYNEDDGLALTLSTLAAAGPWHELIVVDASDTPSAIRQLDQCLAESMFARCLHLIRDGGKGRARQMNSGAQRATGEFIVFLHADTLLPTTASRLISETPTQSPAWGRFDVVFDSDTGWLWWVSRCMNLRSSLTGIVTGDQALFCHRQLFEEAGGFADIPLMEDIEISRRLKRRATPIRLRDKVSTSGRRWQQNGSIRTIVLMWTLRFLYWIGVKPETLSSWYRNTRRG